MIRWMRTVKVAPGKFEQALGWSKEIAGFSNKFEGAPEVKVFIQAFGEIGTLCWSIDYENFADWEKYSKQINADPEWIKKMDATAGMFIEGSGTDNVLSSL